jgi:spore germination cell wall hydrolase CwlJ-like protein
MVAFPRAALVALMITAAGCGLYGAWRQPSAGAPVAASALPVDQPSMRVVRASLFELPRFELTSLALPDGPAAAATSTTVLPAALPSGTLLLPDEDAADYDEPEEPGEPLRGAMKAGAPTFPSIDRSAKGDLRVSRLPPGLEPIAEAEPGYDDGDPLLPEVGAEPLYRLSRQLAPPPAGTPFETFKPSRVTADLAAAMAERIRPLGPEPGGEDGAVPIDHSLAPTGGTSPAAADPDLAGLDTRTTVTGEAPLELAAVSPDPPPLSVTLATVRPTAEADAGAPMPILSPDEGLTTAQKNARIAGLPGLDDGRARPLTLPPVAFTKAQRCMATAIYFEARSESDEGQVAVGQVIINRVRSPFYPKNVCAVVYQGASKRRYGGCQFSFACDLVADRVTEPDSWRQALSIAQRVLDAEAWLPELGNATHYHANYVRPRWVRNMVRKDRIGKHIFYRVRGWA